MSVKTAGGRLVCQEEQKVSVYKVKVYVNSYVSKLGGTSLKRKDKYNMKLQRLIVSKLYGAYNYDVRFNSDITFLYGTNG